MSLFVDVRQSFSSLQLDVRLELGNGLTALVGSSGSGKTTLLNIVAGVMRPERALVRVDKDVLADTPAGIWQPAYRRRIGYVFQEPRLFPHLTVRQNLLYGRWFRRGISTDISPDEVIGLLNLEPLLGRRPSGLSGGEKQRVALGRTLLASPRLLLLDEPLASVDREHRAEILPFLDRIRAEHALPAVYVTHTWSEVAGRADHVVHLRDGKVAFLGSVNDFEGRIPE